MNERQDKIVELVNKKGTVAFRELKDLFPDVSEMTLRRDLEMLDQTKRLVRIHGGARALASLVGMDDLFSRRALTHADAKAVIARKALRFFLPESSLYLDSGSTVTEFAKVLPDTHALICTGSISVALELSKLQHPEVTVFGGKLNSKSLCLSGLHTMSYLDNLNLNFAFLGTTGYSSTQGFSCGNEQEFFLKKKIVEITEKNIILMDSSKVGVVSSYSFANLEDVDVIVSDGNLPPDDVRRFLEAGIEVL